MNVNEQFPSLYLKSSDLNGQMVKVQISDVKSEEIGTDRKMIMYFVGKQKGMVLNKTNAKTLAEQFGDETDNWVGAQIEVFSMKVDYQGRMVDGLRVRIPPQPRKPAARTAEPAANRFAGNARDDDRMNVPPSPPRDAILDDEIPF